MMWGRNILLLQQRQIIADLRGACEWISQCPSTKNNSRKDAKIAKLQAIVKKHINISFLASLRLAYMDVGKGREQERKLLREKLQYLWMDTG